MKKIQLKCRTRGFIYDEVVDVGGKDNISQKDAKSLVGEGLAVDVTIYIDEKSETKEGDEK